VAGIGIGTERKDRTLTLLDYAHEAARQLDVDPDSILDNGDGTYTIGRLRLREANRARPDGCTCRTFIEGQSVNEVRPGDRYWLESHDIDCFVGIVRASLVDVTGATSTGPAGG
jgi:hypothetical protein